MKKNKDILDSVEFLASEIITDYTQERFFGEDEFEDLKASAYRTLINLSQERKLKISVEESALVLRISLQK